MEQMAVNEFWRPLTSAPLSPSSTKPDLFLSLFDTSLFFSAPNVLTGGFDGGYFFVPVDSAIARLDLQGQNVDDWTVDEVGQVREKAQECFEHLPQCVESAESRGHKLFVKEHTVFLADPTVWSRFSLNFTMLPDEFLLTCLPIFLSRHPALAFSSLYRTIVKVEGKEAADRDDVAALIITLEWTRSLYDFYVQRRGSPARPPKLPNGL
ncbi:MAG: hypothetical protein Q9188_004991 [Gyalolechia gomerana]